MASGCISGMTFFFIDFYGTFDQAQAVCGLLPSQLVDTCYAIVGDNSVN